MKHNIKEKTPRGIMTNPIKVDIDMKLNQSFDLGNFNIFWLS